MSEGVYALIGVLLGGLLNVIATWLNEARARKRERRTLARILLSRLSSAADHLAPGPLLGRSGPGPFSGRDDLLEFWQRHERFYADYLDEPDWSTLRQGVIAALSLTAESRRALETDLDKRAYKAELGFVTDAEKVLRPIAEVAAPESEPRDRLTEMLKEEKEKREAAQDPDSGGQQPKAG